MKRITFDEENNEIEKVKIKEDEIIDLSFSSFFYSNRYIDASGLKQIIDKTSNHGLTGIKNLGNSCYISTIIQCLSHSLDFVYFILSRSYESEINKKSKKGMKGQLCETLYNIFYSLWVNNDKYIVPNNLKQIISNALSIFNNSNQQDSCEFLIHILELIHDEFNPNHENVYEEIIPKYKGESDISAAKRFWNQFKKYNNSIIVDLFYGQLKSTVTCLVCSHNSIIFEPFNILNLPIPKMKKIDLIIVPCISIRSTIKINLYVSENAMFWDINKYIDKFMNEKFENFRCLLLHSQTQTARFVKSSDNIYNTSRKGHLFIFEIGDDDESYPFICTIKRDNSNISYPRLFAINPYNNIQELRIMIYGYMKKYYENTNSKYDNILTNYKEAGYLEPLELEEIIKNEYNDNTCLPYSIYLASGNDIMNLDTFNNNLKVEKLIEYVKQGYKLVIDIKDVALEKSMNTIINIENNKDKVISLNDCLDHFTNYEKLDKGNDWYCEGCKKLQHAIRKLEFFYFPKYLIICLKRYESKLISKSQIQLLKNDTFIKYPISKYNIGEYCRGLKNPQIYELYAISQHSGSTEGGHYATACRNFGKWYEFDDISVFPSDEESVVSKEGYILFYRRNDTINKN